MMLFNIFSALRDDPTLTPRHTPISFISRCCRMKWSHFLFPGWQISPFNFSWANNYFTESQFSTKIIQRAAVSVFPISLSSRTPPLCLAQDEHHVPDRDQPPSPNLTEIFHFQFKANFRCCVINFILFHILSILLNELFFSFFF